MVRCILLMSIVATFMISCGKEQSKLPTFPVVEKKPNKLILNDIKVFQKKPIALVLYGDAIYHCSSLSTDDCGTNAVCGEYELNCLKNPTVEYLR
jgi:hypothetical protein